MFTGIVQSTAIVDQIEDRPGFRKLRLQVAARLLQNLMQGASISINGTCLTVTGFDAQTEPGWVQFDLIDETLRLTNLGQLTVGSAVNFERSLTLGSELGGHILSGHIQTQAEVLQVMQTADNWALQLQLEPQWQPYVFSKGFIAIDGISLTVGAVEGGRFWLHIIPETLALTTLGNRQSGDKVNIEIDQQSYTIVQTVERLLLARGLIAPE
ncbi:riboflavin synthase subunit alpha [Rheinheimera riviphila]|uniref:Riboflavin synthase n=1 Tax=Rheinheimera riviphila TaxID=1834037 RepID=A0A437R252_9GAMM|nr:riboflavin synthase subunit alpha [Rheinheimera riviphila]RVU40757.1 riboflavin synthase subunit alpha [Rheinheimera riviphila]